jgi:hypothetical protein
MDADQGVAVAAFVGQGERLERERGAAIALGHDARARGEDPGEQWRELASQPGRETVWRVEQDEIVFVAGVTCAAQERARVLAAQLRALRADPERVEVGPDRARGGGRRVDERGGARAARWLL